MKKNGKIKNSLEIIIILAAALALSAFITAASHKDYEMIALADHWDIYTSDMQESDISMGEVQFSKIQDDDQIHLITTIPEMTIAQPVLTLGISQSAVWVYLDGEEIYSYGQEECEAGQLIGSGYCWIALPDGCSGAQLEIVLQKTAESSFDYMTDLNIISAGDAVYRLISENFLAIVFSIFLIIAGVMMISCAALVKRINMSPRSLASLGFFAILIALWISSNNKTIQLLVTDFHAIPIIEYLSLYFLPTAAASYFYVTFRGKFEKTVMRILEAAYFIAACVVTVLQLLDIRRLPESLLFFQCALLVGLIFIFVFSIKNIMGKLDTGDRMIQNGILVFFLCATLEIIAYIVKRRFDITLPGFSGIIPVGLVIFIIFAASGFVQKSFEYLSKTIEQKALLKIAYTDALTKIDNRARCEDVLLQYQQTKSPVLIINMDLNFFKEVNDTYGHLQGDALLVLFASLLKSVFGSLGTVGRMGGDEFIVIMDADKEELVKPKIHELNQVVEQKNRAGSSPCKLSFAYGYATNREYPGVSPWKVYEYADKKMYRYKQSQKQQLSAPQKNEL